MKAEPTGAPPQALSPQAFDSGRIRATIGLNQQSRSAWLIRRRPIADELE
jgi:hypothetical protein